MTTAPEAATPDIEAPTPGSDSIGPNATAPQADPKPEELSASLFGVIELWLSSLRTAVARAADIAVLEARLAALNLVLIIIFAVASGLFLAMGWIALFAALVAWFHELGLSWSVAILLMAAINLVLAAAGAYAIYRMSNNLLFNAVRKFITYNFEIKDGVLRDVSSGPAAGNTPTEP